MGDHYGSSGHAVLLVSRKLLISLEQFPLGAEEIAAAQWSTQGTISICFTGCLSTRPVILKRGQLMTALPRRQAHRSVICLQGCVGPGRCRTMTEDLEASLQGSGTGHCKSWQLAVCWKCLSHSYLGVFSLEGEGSRALNDTAFMMNMPTWRCEQESDPKFKQRRQKQRQMSSFILFLVTLHASVGPSEQTVLF
jgi:hypothetical protein